MPARTELQAVTLARGFKPKAGRAKPPILVLGFGGNAIDAMDTIESNFDIVGFVDDDPERQLLNFEGIPVYSRVALEKFRNVKF